MILSFAINKFFALNISLIEVDFIFISYPFPKI